MKRRFGAEIDLKPPQVPYIETIRKSAKAYRRYKKQTGGRGWVRGLPHRDLARRVGCRIRVREQDQGW